MSYLLLASVLSLLCQGAGSDNDKTAENQRRLKDAEWKWLKHQTNLLWCIHIELNDYEVQMNRPQNRTREGMQVQLLRDGKEVCTFKAYPNTALVRNRKDNLLYVTDFYYGAGGCDVHAFDLTERKKLWKTTLQGLEQTAQYSNNNEVNIVLENDLVIVYGKEKTGRYIELIEAKSGKTVGNKKLEKE